MRKILPVLAAAAGGYFYAMYRSGRSGLHPVSRAIEEGIHRSEQL